MPHTIIIMNFKGSECLLTPERSIEIQNAIGADIIMQLDDVVSSTVSGPRVEEAMHRYDCFRLISSLLFDCSNVNFLISGQHVG